MTHINKNNNLDLAEKFLKIAKEDLEASICLYDKGHYPESIYHLQQSAEKLVKSYFLKIGMDIKEFKEYLHTHKPINPHVLKAIMIYFFGYKYRNIIIVIVSFDNKFLPLDPIEIFKNLNLREIFKDPNLIEKVLPSYPIEIFDNPIKIFKDLILHRLDDENFNNKWKDESKKYYDVEREKYESLKGLNIDDEEKILKKGKEEILKDLFPSASFTSLPKSMPNQLYVEILKLCDSLATNEKIKKYVDECFFEAYGKNMDEYFEDCYEEFQFQKGKKMKKNIIRGIVENMIKDISINFANRDDSIIKIMRLAIITGPHEACTRYPGETLEPSDYKPGLGIVDAYLDIYKGLKEWIEKYEKAHFIADKK